MTIKYINLYLPSSKEADKWDDNDDGWWPNRPGAKIFSTEKDKWRCWCDGGELEVLCNSSVEPVWICWPWCTVSSSSEKVSEELCKVSIIMYNVICMRHVFRVPSSLFNWEPEMLLRLLSHWARNSSTLGVYWATTFTGGRSHKNNWKVDGYCYLRHPFAYMITFDI